MNSIQLVNAQLIHMFREFPLFLHTYLQTACGKACEEKPVQTNSRGLERMDKTGTYILKLSFHSSPSQLRAFRVSAFRRFNFLLNSFNSAPVNYKQYRHIMREYQELEHMELVLQSKYS